MSQKTPPDITPLSLSKLKLINYKNYENQSIEFHPRLNAILGLNGSGKTNLLDAIHYLSIGKSYFSSSDRYVKNLNADFFRLEAVLVVNEEQDNMIVKCKPGSLKELEVNGKKLNKISEHVGRYPCVVISPSDIQLLLDASIDRRAFMDKTIAQYDKAYLLALSSYNRLLKQRNAYLKNNLGNRNLDEVWISAIDDKMEQPAQVIHDSRKKFIEEIGPIFKSYYKKLSKGKEACMVAYQSGLQEHSIKEILALNREKDRIMGRTTGGVHKDDLLFSMNDERLKLYGSQGQLKTYVLALKLAQYAVMQAASNMYPLLLMDDVFDKLDHERVSHLLQVLSEEISGQVFLTDKDVKTIPMILDPLSIDYSIFEVEKGNIE